MVVFAIDIEEATIRRCLSIMLDAVVDNLNPERDCDFNILPKKSKDGTWKTQKNIRDIK